MIPVASARSSDDERRGRVGPPTREGSAPVYQVQGLSYRTPAKISFGTSGGLR